MIGFQRTLFCRARVRSLLYGNEMDSVHLALFGAQSASDALFGIHLVGGFLLTLDGFLRAHLLALSASYALFLVHHCLHLLMEGDDAVLGALLGADEAAAALLVIELGKVGLLVDVHRVAGAVLLADAAGDATGGARSLYGLALALVGASDVDSLAVGHEADRSEEHTSELQSRI